MAAGVNVPLTFEIYKGDQLVKTETLTLDVIKIGKLSTSSLRVEDEDVSRMHAVIEVTSPTEIHIIDLGSTKGTVVNGQKVNKAKLSSGDQIVLGGTRLVVTIGEPVAAEAAEAAPAPRETTMGMKTVPAPIPAPVAAAAPAAAAAGPAPVAARQPQTSMAPPMLAAPTYMGKPIDPAQIEIRDGSRAVEVMALFEDAIVEAHHFSNPKAGVVTGQTKGMIFGGLAALATSLIVFVVAYVQVSHEKAMREALERAGTAASAMPAAPPSGSAVDILVALLLIGGLVSLVFGLFRRHEELQPRDFTIGPDPDAMYNAPGDLLPAPLFPLVRSTGSAYELLFSQQMKGDVDVGGKRTSLAELVSAGRAHAASAVSGAYSMPIADGMRAKLDLGESTFLVNSVPPPRRQPVPVAFDWRANSYTGGTFVVVALFLALIFSIPPDPKSLSLDAFMNDQRFAKFLIKPPEEKQEEIPEWLKKKTQDDAGGKGKRHKDEEGKMGKKQSKNKAGLYALKGPQDNKDLHLAKVFAEEQAKNAGVLGILKNQEGSHLASIFGRDSALGADADNVMGGLVGTAVGEAYGVGGLGLVGSGRGGGGTGEGTIGLGNLGTIGKGGGGGSGSGYGRGAGGLGGRRAHAPEVVPGTAQVRGSLDKEIIRRIIRRHINEVKFCYEKELTTHPDLYGRVIVQFIIAGDGHVMTSLVQSSTMNNPLVEQCIAGAVRRWEFPKPQGGGIVQVSYPFVLKAAGGDE
jgi:hypothetical protein